MTEDYPLTPSGANAKKTAAAVTPKSIVVDSELVRRHRKQQATHCLLEADYYKLLPGFERKEGTPTSASSLKKFTLIPTSPAIKGDVSSDDEYSGDKENNPELSLTSSPTQLSSPKKDASPVRQPLRRHRRGISNKTPTKSQTSSPRYHQGDASPNSTPQAVQREPFAELEKTTRMSFQSDATPAELKSHPTPFNDDSQGETDEDSDARRSIESAGPLRESFTFDQKLEHGLLDKDLEGQVRETRKWLFSLPQRQASDDESLSSPPQNAASPIEKNEASTQPPNVVVPKEDKAVQNLESNLTADCGPERDTTGNGTAIVDRPELSKRPEHSDLGAITDSEAAELEFIGSEVDSIHDLSPHEGRTARAAAQSSGILQSESAKALPGSSLPSHASRRLPSQADVQQDQNTEPNAKQSATELRPEPSRESNADVREEAEGPKTSGKAEAEAHIVGSGPALIFSDLQSTEAASHLPESVVLESKLDTHQSPAPSVEIVRVYSAPTPGQAHLFSQSAAALLAQYPDEEDMPELAAKLLTSALDRKASSEPQEQPGQAAQTAPQLESELVRVYSALSPGRADAFQQAAAALLERYPDDEDLSKVATKLLQRRSFELAEQNGPTQHADIKILKPENSKVRPSTLTNGAIAKEGATIGLPVSTPPVLRDDVQDSMTKSLADRTLHARLATPIRLDASAGAAHNLTIQKGSWAKIWPSLLSAALVLGVLGISWCLKDLVPANDWKPYTMVDDKLVALVYDTETEALNSARPTLLLTSPSEYTQPAIQRDELSSVASNSISGSEPAVAIDEPKLDLNTAGSAGFAPDKGLQEITQNSAEDSPTEQLSTTEGEVLDVISPETKTTSGSGQDVEPIHDIPGASESLGRVDPQTADDVFSKADAPTATSDQSPRPFSSSAILRRIAELSDLVKGSFKVQMAILGAAISILAALLSYLLSSTVRAAEESEDAALDVEVDEDAAEQAALQAEDSPQPSHRSLALIQAVLKGKSPVPTRSVSQGVSHHTSAQNEEDVDEEAVDEENSKPTISKSITKSVQSLAKSAQKSVRSGAGKVSSVARSLTASGVLEEDDFEGEVSSHNALRPKTRSAAKKAPTRARRRPDPIPEEEATTPVPSQSQTPSMRRSSRLRK